MSHAQTQLYFTEPLLAWYYSHGRRNLPWQNPRSPYRVWISEVMLQQTQVKTVIPYFNRFIARFPDVETLAKASLDEVLSFWAGLGYYSRGRNLHKTAILLNNDYQGKIPHELSVLKQLPGIGASTAAAIVSLAYNQPAAILDGNVKRVLSRYFRIAGLPSSKITLAQLWEKAEDCLSQKHPADYTQAIMDLGALCCSVKQPQCGTCPLQSTCSAKAANEVANYPTKKATKPLPEKEQSFLLLYTDENLLYLERRPSSGIWGGLWCLPCIEKEICPQQYITTHYSFKVLEMKKLVDLKHTFTHFKLSLRVLSIRVELSSLKLAQSSGTWFTHQQIKSLGLPKPISTTFEFFLGNKP